MFAACTHAHTHTHTHTRTHACIHHYLSLPLLLPPSPSQSFSQFVRLYAINMHDLYLAFKSIPFNTACIDLAGNG